MPKVLLQDLRSLKFLDPNGEWTREPEVSLDFGEVVAAADFVLGHTMHHVRVVLWFAGAEADVALPPAPA